MAFIYALVGALVLVFVVHVGKTAYDCNQAGGSLVKAVMPFEFVCLPVKSQ